MDLKIGMVVSIESGAEYSVLGDDGNIQKANASSTANYLVVSTDVGDPEISEDTVLRNLQCGTNVYAHSGDLVRFRGFCPKCGKIAPYCSSCDTLHCSCQKG